MEKGKWERERNENSCENCTHKKGKKKLLPDSQICEQAKVDSKTFDIFFYYPIGSLCLTFQLKIATEIILDRIKKL